jgi:Ca2+-binding RTX toxin-like protein
MTAGSIGSRYIEITLASVTANQFAGGYLTVGSGTGLAQHFRIKGNTATGNPATGNIRIQLYEAITVAVAADSDVIITGNPFNDIIVADGTNYVIAGVSVSTTTAAKPYGWFLVRGITACLQDDTTTALAAGKGIQLSSAVAGAVSLWGNAATTVANLQGLRYLGECVGITGATSYAMCKFILG